jgi:uncharacterized protein
MKYLIVALVVGLAFWIWRKNRSEATRSVDQPQPQETKVRHTQPQLMITCSVCGVHLPKADAVTGQHGSYCSAAHRQEKEA